MFSLFVLSTWRNHHHIPSFCASVRSPSFCTAYALADALPLFPVRFLMIASSLSSSFAVYADGHTHVPRFRFRWLMVIPPITLRFRLVPRHTIYISYPFHKRSRCPPGPVILFLLPFSRHIITFLRGFIPSGLVGCSATSSLPLPSDPFLSPLPSLRSPYSRQGFHTSIPCTVPSIAIPFLFVPCFRRLLL